MSQTLILDDIQPNINQIINLSKRHWGLYYNKKRQWHKLIKGAVQEQNIQPYSNKIDLTVQLVYPDKRRRDPDNYHILKFILDGLVSSGILIDDSHRYIGNITFNEPKIQSKTKRTEITFKERV